MRKLNWKAMLHLLIFIGASFIAIYLLVFVGGWKLIEAGDIISIEIAVSVIVGFVVWIIFEVTKLIESKINALEKRVEELENKNHDDLNS